MISESIVVAPRVLGASRVLLDELIIGRMIVILPAQGILRPIVVILGPIRVLVLRAIITNRWTKVVVVLGKPSILGSTVPASASLRGGSTSGLPPVCPLWSRRRVLILLSRLLLLRSALWMGHRRLLLRGLLPRRVLRWLRVRRLRREPRLLLWVRRLRLVPRRRLRVRQLLRVPWRLLRVRRSRLVRLRRLLLLLLSALLLGCGRLPRSRLASLGWNVWRDRRWCRVYCWSLPGSPGTGLRYIQPDWVY